MNDEQVRGRAYALWERDGRLHGRDLIHWFQAEAETSSPFPENDFGAFARAANTYFPEPLSDDVLFDHLEKSRQFDWSWQAVRFRYRLCAECCGEFRALLFEPSDAWAAGSIDKEYDYRVERSIYVFFVSALSVLESFAFCLYFVGNAIQPNSFPDVGRPRKITVTAASEAFGKAFPNAAISRHLKELTQKNEYKDIEELRNVLAHRLAGRRSSRDVGGTQTDGTYTHTHEEFWHVPDFRKSLSLDEGLLQRHLNDLADLVYALALAARNFAETKGAA